MSTTRASTGGSTPSARTAGFAPLSNLPSMCTFDVVLAKAKDGSLGINVRESALLTSPKTITRIVGYKPVNIVNNRGEVGPAEACGYVRESDIIVGVGNEDVIGAAFQQIVNKIKNSPPDAVRLRLLRPNPFTQFSGVAPASNYVGAGATGFVAALHDGLGSVYIFGPFVTEAEAALAFDTVVLSVYGTRASSFTNFFTFLSSPLLSSELSASAVAAAGNTAGARQMLMDAGAFGSFTYVGSGRFSSEVLAAHKFLERRVESEAEMLGRQSHQRARGTDTQVHGPRAADLALSLALLAAPHWRAGQWAPESATAFSSAEDAGATTQDEDDGQGHAGESLAWFTDKHGLWAAAVASQCEVFKADAAELAANPEWIVQQVSGELDEEALPPVAPLLGCLFPAFKAPPFGPAHGFSYQDVTPHHGVGDDVVCSVAQRGGKPRDADGTAGRFRLLTSTLLRAAPAAEASAPSTALALPSAMFSSIKPVEQSFELVTSAPAYQKALGAVHGGPGAAHKLFVGVRHPVEPMPGAFAVCAVPGPWHNLILGFFPTAVQAAIAHDRAVRKLQRRGAIPPAQANQMVNFDNTMPAGAITTAVWNTMNSRPELFLLSRETMSAGPVLAPALKAVGPGFTKEAIAFQHPKLVPADVEQTYKDYMTALGFTLAVPRAHLADTKAAEEETVPLPPEYAPYVGPLGITMAQLTDSMALLRVMVSQSQRTMLKNQILVMKALMKNQLPAPNVVQEATSLDIVPTKKSKAPVVPGLTASPGGSRMKAATPVPLRGKKGGYKGRKKRRSKRESDDDDEEDELDEEDSNWRKAKPQGGSGVRRSSRAGSARKVYNDGEEEDADQANDDEDEASEEESRVARKKKAGRPSTTPSKLTIGALDDDDDDDQNKQWRVEKIIAVRYADLPDDPDDPIDEVAKLPANASEEAKALAHDRKQLRLRKAMPIEQRRDWETLEFLVRWKGLSYLHVEWVASSLVKEQGVWGVKRAKNFVASEEARRQLDDEEARLAAGRDPLPMDAYFEEDYIVVERILGSKEVEVDDNGKPAKRTMYLVKWKGLPYAECTWEWDEDFRDDKKVAQFHRFNAMPRAEDVVVRYDNSGRDVRPDPRDWKPYKESPLFKDSRALRDYQLEGLNWLVFNWHNHRNSILADEMGLGKTVQTVSVLEHLRTRAGVRGPFLVLAPLSTLGHWKREFDEWTDMNAVYYHDPQGGAEARALIREYEWTYPGPKGERLAAQGIYKFNALVTSYHVLLSDWEFFEKIRWRYVVVDEAHALKNRESQLKQALRSMNYDSLLLLTGTPLQNDVVELWSLLELIRPDKYASLQDFIVDYGELKDSSQVAKLQKELTPIMLRRAKEDVEKSIPPKEETLINVELTRLQKAYYRAVFDRNRGFLSRGAANTAVANLVNIEMELRKCCNHPYLLRGAEERENGEGVEKAQRIENMVAASGKMVLLDKLLPKLHEEGHRVLIFSQFKMMLGLIEELLAARHYKYERLDGSIRGNERQAAIDRFNKAGSDIFAFLLSTKAGGQGINLTAADTVIIFDSDWNPQNDVQAMARAHRIGQTKDVRIYRLVTSKTYEAEMFKRASRKLGLSQAVFESGGVSKRFDASGAVAEDEGGDSLSGLLTMDKDKVEALLRFGAYAIMDDEEANDAAAKFQASSIDQILSKSATIRYDESAAKAAELGEEGEGAAEPGAEGQRRGINLSKATFAVDEGDSKLDVSDPSFWEKVLGPKPAETLSRDLQAVPSVLEDPVKLSQWVSDFTALLDDVFEARTGGENHEGADAVQAILLELQVLGKKFPHPLSPAGRSRWITATSGAAWAFPSPSPAITSSCMAATVAAAHARSRAAAGRGSAPEQDGDGKQHDGTLAEFAVYWIDRLEQGRRGRKRGRGLPVSYAAPSTPSLPPADGKPRGRGRPRTRPRKEDLEVEGEEAVELGENGEPLPVSGRKRNRGLKENVGAGERDVDTENGLPSISNFRIRITPVGPGASPVVVPLGPYTATVNTLPSAWLEEHPEYAPADRPSSPTTVEPGPQTITMPGDLFDRSGFTRAQVLAASAAGMSVEDYAEKERDGTLLQEPGEDDESKTEIVVADGIDRTKRMARWHLAYNKSTSQAAARVFPPPEALPTGDVKLTIKPMQVVAVFTSGKGITLKPRDAKGPKGFVPNWVLAGMPVDRVEEEKRVARRTQWAKKNQERQAERAEAKRVAAAAMTTGGEDDGNSAPEDDEGSEEELEEEEFSDEEGSEEEEAPRPAAKRARTSSAGPKSTPRGAKNAKVATLDAPDDAACCVCNGTEGFADDPIVLCEGADCGIAVHKQCYGIPTIPEGDTPYYCSVCDEKANGVALPAPDAIPCPLCPLTGGAYKRTKHSGTILTDPKTGKPQQYPFVHAICALWCPLCTFDDDEALEPVRGWEAVRGLPEWSQTCCVCKQSSCGFCAPCSSPGCRLSVHPSCGRRAHLRMEMTPEGSLQAFCTEHSK